MKWKVHEEDIYKMIEKRRLSRHYEIIYKKIRRFFSEEIYKKKFEDIPLRRNQEGFNKTAREAHSDSNKVDGCTLLI